MSEKFLETVEIKRSRARKYDLKEAVKPPERKRMAGHGPRLDICTGRRTHLIQPVAFSPLFPDEQSTHCRLCHSRATPGNRSAQKRSQSWMEARDTRSLGQGPHLLHPLYLPQRPAEELAGQQCPVPSLPAALIGAGWEPELPAVLPGLYRHFS